MTQTEQTEYSYWAKPANETPQTFREWYKHARSFGKTIYESIKFAREKIQ